MRKILNGVAMITLCALLVGCGVENEHSETTTETLSKFSDETKEENDVFPTSEQLLTLLKSHNQNLEDVEVFNENTDPNKLLGKIGEYVSKADFSDSRLKQDSEYLCGGTIETFSSKKDCEDRVKYLSKFDKPILGSLGINAYIYQYDLAILRVDKKLTEEQAEEYNNQLSEIIEKWRETGILEIETENESETLDVDATTADVITEETSSEDENTKTEDNNKEINEMELEDDSNENPFPNTKDYIVNNVLIEYNKIAEYPISDEFINGIKRISRPLGQATIVVSNGVYFIIRYNDYNRILFIDYQEETDDDSGLYAVVRDVSKVIKPEMSNEEVTLMIENVKEGNLRNYFDNSVEEQNFIRH